MQTRTEPCAWVGCLGCYNNGELVGEWLDVEGVRDLDSTGLTEGGRCVRCGAEEFDVMDVEGIRHPGGHYFSPASFVETVDAFADIPDHIPHAAVVAWLDNQHGDLDALANIEDRYQGHWDTFRDYSDERAEEMFGSELASGSPLARYFDWGAYADDIRHDYTVFNASDYGDIKEHGVFVFTLVESG